jgi:kanamycin kinase
MQNKFTDWAKKEIGEDLLVSKEGYGDQNIVYQLDAPTGSYFLKIGLNLIDEKLRLEWLKDKLPIPRVIGFTSIGEKDALLMTAIKGRNLAELKKEWPVEKVLKELAEVLQRFHSTNTGGCPFGAHDPEMVLIHGDACLPNFIFYNGKFSGYIDLGDMHVGNVELDLSAAIWSLQYNLGPGYGLSFLQQYGIKDATEELVERLRLKYEDMEEKWGHSA